MRYSLTSTLLFAIYASMATVSSAEVKTPSQTCRDLCTSLSAGECVKKFIPIISNAGVECVNVAVQPYSGACKEKCMDEMRACSKNCFVLVGPQLEACVDQYADHTDPKRIQCLKDVEEPRRTCSFAC